MNWSSVLQKDRIKIIIQHICIELQLPPQSIIAPLLQVPFQQLRMVVLYDYSLDKIQNLNRKTHLENQGVLFLQIDWNFRQKNIFRALIVSILEEIIFYYQNCVLLFVGRESIYINKENCLKQKNGILRIEIDTQLPIPLINKHLGMHAIIF
jgi:hypothetical protein